MRFTMITVEYSDLMITFGLAFWPPSCHAAREMAGGPWQMRTRRRRCLVFAAHMASDYLPRIGLMDPVFPLSSKTSMVSRAPGATCARAACWHIP